MPGAPVSLIGLVALPWVAGGSVLKPVVWLSVLTFVATTLLFPVSTTWGTFLHAAGPVHVLLIVSGLLALDRVIVRAGAWRGWTKPVAWLAPTLTVSAAILFSVGDPGLRRRRPGTRSGAMPRSSRRWPQPAYPVDPAARSSRDFPIW